MIDKVKPEHRMVKGMVYDVQIDDNFIRVDQHYDQYYFLIHPVPQTEVCHVEVCGLSESTRVKIGQMHLESDGRFKFTGYNGESLAESDFLILIREIPVSELLYKLDRDAARILLKRK